MKRWQVGFLGVLVSALAIGVIAAQIDLSRLANELASARYIYVLPCVVFLLVGLVTRALRWRVLLSDLLPVGRAFSIMNVAYLVNNILPLRIGEVARAYLATRHHPPVPVPTTISTIVVERLLDLMAILVLLGLALLAGPLPDELRAAGLITAPMVIVGFLVLVVLAARRRFTQALVAWLAVRVPLLERIRFQVIVDHFLDGLMPITQPRSLASALVWTAVSWGFSVLAGYNLMFAFYEQASWAATCLYIAAAAFAIAAPAVPGNLGTYELSILLALSAVGYGEPADTAAAFAVLVHGINLAVHCLTGLAGFIREGVTLSQLSDGVQNIRQKSASIQTRA